MVTLQDVIPLLPQGDFVCPRLKGRLLSHPNTSSSLKIPLVRHSSNTWSIQSASIPGHYCTPGVHQKSSSSCSRTAQTGQSCLPVSGRLTNQSQYASFVPTPHSDHYSTSPPIGVYNQHTEITSSEFTDSTLSRGYSQHTGLAYPNAVRMHNITQLLHHSCPNQHNCQNTSNNF